VKGNVENPQFNLQETLLTQVAISLAQALGIPIKVIGEEVFRDTLKGEKGLFKRRKRKRSEYS